MEIKKRIDWIDVAKGIGIIMVVLSHFSLSESDYAIKFVFAFHMPLFFFLSGMVFNAEIPFKKFIFKKFKSIYVPFFVFLCIEYLICIITRYETLLIKDVVAEFVFQATGFDLGNDSYLFNGPIWFLCALFFAETAFYFIAKKNNIILYIVTIVVSLICTYFVDFRLPFGIGYIFSSSIFMASGCIVNKIMKTCNFQKFEKNKIAFISIFALCFLILFFTADLNDMMVMRTFSYGNYFLFIVNSFLGIVMIIAISIILQKNRVLRFYGKNSIILLCLHLYFTDKLVPIVFNILSVDASVLQNVYYCRAIQMLFLFVIIVCFYPIILLVNKYFYFVFGKSHPNSLKKKK